MLLIPRLLIRRPGPESRLLVSGLLVPGFPFPAETSDSGARVGARVRAGVGTAVIGITVPGLLFQEFPIPGLLLPGQLIPGLEPDSGSKSGPPVPGLLIPEVPISGLLAQSVWQVQRVSGTLLPLGHKEDCSKEWGHYSYCHFNESLCAACAMEYLEYFQSLVP